VADFDFIHIPNFESWVINAPHRSHRPVTDLSHKKNIACPFCPGTEKLNEEVYRIGGRDHDRHWTIRVLKNKFPFAPIHEVVIHTPEHDKGIQDLSKEQIRLIFETYVNRFTAHMSKGTVCIFANAGHMAGESIIHSHSQIAVTPKEVPIVVPRLEEDLAYKGEYFDAGEFKIISPPYSQWPDEVWIVPHERGKLFSEIRFEEIENISFLLQRLIKIFSLRHGNDFPYNYYIYPYRDWYLRILPRAKVPGGFEIATGIFVNTQDPKETMQFIKNHLFEDDAEKIKTQKAEYRRGV
jgi:UDPglucose--hexose-1-phosphate uridylyltransferase